MIVSASQLLQVFDAVRQDKHMSDDKGLLIFVANGDVDSLCAVYQLENILSKFDMVTSITPVANYEAIQKACETDRGLTEAKELRTVIMINCGATDDVRTMLGLNVNVRIVIIDSHRPIWHGHNVDSDQSTVLVLDDDDPVPLREVPEYKEGDREFVDDAPPDDLSSSSDDDDDEEDGGRGGGQDGIGGGGPLQGEGQAGEDARGEKGRVRDARRRRREAHDRGRGGGGDLPQGGGETSGSEDGEDSRDGGSGNEGGQGEVRGRVHGEREGRPRKRARGEERDEGWEAHKQAVAAYYESKAGYGKPAALLLLGLAHAMQLDDNFHIWLAILGITDQYIHQRMDPHLYIKWRIELEGHVANHNGLVEFDSEDPHAAAGSAGGGRLSQHRISVVSVNELKVPLLRRWSLLEAFQYTPHVATRMQTWRDAGKKNVELFLAAMNVNRTQRTRDFSGMNHNVFPHMMSKIKDICTKFGLVWEALRYDGFELHYKKDFRLLATDYVLAITAMLARPRDEGCSEMDAFVHAMDCLKLHKVEGVTALKQGFDHAKKLAMTVVERGGYLMSQHSVRGSKNALPFWYLDLSNLTIQSANELHHHSTLVNLALFVRDAMSIRCRAQKPLFLIGPPDHNNQCYMVTVRDRLVAGVMQNNPFSVPLQEAIQEVVGQEDARATFDNTVYLVKQSVVPQILAEVKMKIANYKMSADL